MCGVVFCCMVCACVCVCAIIKVHNINKESTEYLAPCIACISSLCQVSISELLIIFSPWRIVDK